ncbi:MAG: hypothetical protein V2A70_04080, partial [Candidatus Omnitrophota bacterium]
LQLLEDAAIFNDHHFLTGDAARDKQAVRLARLIAELDTNKVSYVDILIQVKSFVDSFVNEVPFSRRVEKEIQNYEKRVDGFVAVLANAYKTGRGIEWNKDTGILIVDIKTDLGADSVLEFIDSPASGLSREEIRIVLTVVPAAAGKRYKFFIIPKAHPDQVLNSSFYEAFDKHFAGILKGSRFGGREDAGGSPREGMALDDVAVMRDYLASVLDLTKISQVDVNPALLKKGGIDLNSANLNLQIKRDGAGVPLPVRMQNLENIRIDGLTPEIILIQPVTNLPVLGEALAEANSSSV